MAGRKAFIAFCWPLHPGMSNVLAEFFPVLFIELTTFLVCTQVVLWWYDSLPSTPTSDPPYIPRGKRPPSYLGPFLDWLRNAIDQLADRVSPNIKSRRHTRHPHSTRMPPTTGTGRPLVLLHVFPVLVTYAAVCESLFLKWNFLWWRVRLRAPRRTARHLMALSALAAEVARANAAVSNAASRRAIFDSDSFNILVDGGATACISNALSDFVTPPRTSTVLVKGFNGATSTTRVGTVRWIILDDTGQRRTLEVKNTYYVPECPLRLLSPQHYSQQLRDHRGTYSVNYGDQVVFVWGRGRFKATMPLTTVTNVGILRSAPGHASFSSFASLATDISPPLFCCNVITDDDADDESDPDDDDDATWSAANLEGDDASSDINLANPPTSIDKAPVVMRPAVIPFDLDHDRPPTNLPSQDDATSALSSQAELLRWHYRLGHLPFPNIRLMAAKGEIPKRLSTCRIPRCQSCLYGKATKKPWRTKAQPARIRTVTRPGECVSVDQLESPVPGLKGQNKGYFYRERYKVATIFVDHFSRLSYVHLQESTKGLETLLAKRAFEAYAASFGVVIANYHADNGRFAERLFLDHAELHGQGVSLCGVNAHFQNGIAEKRIRDLTERARTSLLHAVSRWPSAVTINLWPYALRFANETQNSTPSLALGHTPLEAFSGVPVRPQVLNYHPPFCPAYVLHTGLQGGGKRPNKWVRISRAAIYLGPSPRHARSVALVLSLTTGYVSPQFHLKYDDFFETVQEAASLPQSNWQQLARFTKPGVQPRKPARTKAPHSAASHAPHSDEVAAQQGLDPLGFDFADLGEVDDEITDQDREAEHFQEPLPPGELPVQDKVRDPERHHHPDSTRRSARQRNPPQRLIETAYAVLDRSDAVEDYETQNLADDPIAFAASKSDPDTLHYNEAMSASDSVEFKRAMLLEVNAHTDNDHWEVWEKARVPVGQDILPAVWAFKRKRRIDTGVIYKYKARLNIHGGMQKHGINYWETYSPVVNWFSIRLCLILTLLFKWQTRQIDFVLAFLQADVECDLFMQLPRGLTFPGVHRSSHCLKLKKNLYGSRQAGRVWNQHLVNGLVNVLKFKQSAVDECVFY